MEASPEHAGPASFEVEADASAGPTTQFAESAASVLRRIEAATSRSVAAEAEPDVEEVPTGPVVRPTKHGETPAFQMGAGLTGTYSYHYHPDQPGFRVDCYLAPDELSPDLMPFPGIKVYLPVGRRELEFPFSDCPTNTWVSFHDDHGNVLPFQVFIDGNVRVLGRWLQ